MGKYQRNKGANFEREIANFLKANGFPQARRGIGQSRSAKEVSDVEGTPFWVECKVGAGPSVRAAIAQAEAATDGRPIAVVVKWDGGKPYVLFGLEDLACFCLGSGWLANSGAGWVVRKLAHTRLDVDAVDGEGDEEYAARMHKKWDLEDLQGARGEGL